MEGLIHNLNNPLNLILGYSHILRKAQPESEEAEKIYQAGIRIDETLKELYNRILERSFAESQEISPASWLDAELGVVQHYLPIKHSFTFVREDNANFEQVFCSVPELSLWYETALLKLKDLVEPTQLYTGVTQHEGKCAIYIRLQTALEPELAGQLISSVQNASPQGENPGIASLWLSEHRMLVGVIA